MENRPPPNLSNGPPFARRLRRRLITIYLIGASMAAVAGIVLFLFGLDLTERQMTIYFASVPLPLAIMTVLDIVTINIHYRPLGLFLGLAAERRPSADVAAAALVRALNLPALAVLRILLVHLPAFYVPSVLFGALLNRHAGFDLPLDRFIIGGLLVLFISTGHAIFEYFAVGATMRPVIGFIRSYCDELSPEQQRRLIPVGMRRKLLAVSAFVVFVPLLVLGFSVLNKFNRLLIGLDVGDVSQLMAPLQRWVILVAAGSTAVTFFMSIGMAREFTSLVDQVVRAMRRVEDKELDTHLAVTTTDEFATLYQGFNHMTRGLQERERLRDAFGRYVAPEVAEEVMRHGISLGGETVAASVLFADIRDFTSLSERLSPSEVVNLLNGYFAAVEPVITSAGGWINKFGGDSLLAVFGAPVPQADHAQRAVQAARGMRASLAEFNAHQRQVGGPMLRIGVGVDCGEMVAGSVGSPERMEYTVIGDVVNVASRIEALNKLWGSDVLISANVYAAIGTDVKTTSMPLIKIVGKSDPIQVYALE